MGYRSEVCIGLTDDATRLLMTMLEHLPPTHEVHELLNDARRGYQVAPDAHRNLSLDCEEKLHWDYVKWYENYEDVGFVEEFLSECIPEEDYRFVRIGEDSEDVEQRGEYYDSEIYINRSISW